MAEQIVWVNPDAVGAADGSSEADGYTSLNAAEAAKQGDHVSNTDNYMFKETSSGGTADTTPTTFNGSITSAIYDIKILGKDDIGTSWNESLYRLEVADATALIVLDNYITVGKLQIGKSSSSANFQICVLAWDVNFDIYNCILKQAGNTTYKEPAISVDNASAVARIWNVIAYGLGSFVSSDNTPFKITNSTSADMYNCTSYGGYRGYRQQAGTVTCTNSIAANQDATSFLGTITVDHCNSDDGTGTNAQTPIGSNWDDEFVTPGTDFALEPAGNCVGNGTDDPASGLYSDDITGAARTSPWGIGAAALIAAVAGNPWYYYAQQQ